ncbi:hypothetical protein GOP47_0004032 [Adiantum capillus-veneris]|uniref:DUF1664 domain-containing protein n=1 Tax=Adiantum capillus-veneris TaxID=13818 RepID=A0A9D4V6U0_ADICA|nr:hypothetical protein GOP47_0004032 [Adiantum capillus-veneris]
MVLQLALGASKLLLVLGAGVAGSILVQNGNLSDFVNDTYKVLVKHLKHESGPSQKSSVDPNLLAQLSRLKQELSNLSSERASVTIVTSNSRSSGLVVCVGVPALVVSAAGYGYMRWRGLSFSDLMYVTRHSMSEAISTVSKQLEQVTSALSASKRHLNTRIDKLSSNLDENKELQIDLKDEVGNLRGDIARYGLEIETVQRIVQTLGVKIDSIENKQDIANTGVIYLCNFVEGMQAPQQNPTLQGGFRRPRLERSASTFGSTGLKELHSISHALQSLEMNTDLTSQGQDEGASSLAPSPSLQRTFTNTSTGLPRPPNSKT